MIWKPVPKDEELGKSDGSAFHSLGAAILKAPSPNELSIFPCGSSKIVFKLERSIANIWSAAK